MVKNTHLTCGEALDVQLKDDRSSELVDDTSKPIYLGVKTDRALTYRHHLKTLRRKLSMSVLLLRRLAGSEWCAGAKALCTGCLVPDLLDC